VMRWESTIPLPLGRHDHDAVISAMELSPDGTRVLFGDRNGGVSLWNLGNGPVRQFATRHQAGIKALAFDPTGKRCAVGDAAGFVRLWDVDSGNQIAEIDNRGLPPLSLAFLENGSLLLAACEDKSEPIRRWAVQASAPHSLDSCLNKFDAT